MMNPNSKILILGSRGMVGSALIRELEKLGHKNILKPVRPELDLLNQAQTLAYFEKNKPDFVFDAAAKVGGIVANNTYRADFIFENLTIQNNVFEACHKFNVKKLLFLGSSCIYPKACPQPIKEEYLLTGPLEPTNEPYAIAKIAGLKMAESFRKQYGHQYFSVMPTNLYGVNDNFHLENSHVIPGLIARMYQAKIKNEKVFKIWGTGKPRREFLFVDDMARACIHFMNQEGSDIPDFVNVGTGEDITIKELAEKIQKLLNFEGTLEFDATKPDGMMRKQLDVSKVFALNWRPQITLDVGLKKSIDYFLTLQN